MCHGSRWCESVVFVPTSISSATVEKFIARVVSYRTRSECVARSSSHLAILGVLSRVVLCYRVVWVFEVGAAGANDVGAAGVADEGVADLAWHCGR